jgi:hypothetical protein
MKILLLGEFSGVHNNLKKKLLFFGHEVKLGADGDSYRGFDYDFKINPYESKFLNLFYFIWNFRKFIGYDVVQFITPFAIPYHYHFFGLTHVLFRFNKVKIYYACGTDPAFMSVKDKFKYFPLDGKTSKLEYFPNYNKFSMNYYNWFINKIDWIVPSMYSYYLGYKSNSKTTSPIPLPASGFKNGDFKKKQSKVKILFGITRRDFKGSKYILDAIKLIESKFPNLVNVTVVEGLTIKEYKKLLLKSDILIDQCKTYDYGMNAIFAMENGCIVFSGSESKSMKYLNFKNCPVINILPDSKDIFNKISSIIELENNDIEKLKKKSLSFVREYHSLEKITNDFLHIYNR